MTADSNVYSNAHLPSNSQAAGLQALLKYCVEKNVFISPSIAAQSFPGRGLGVYTLKKVRKGEKLIHVPIQTIVTTRSIPESFMSKNLRKKFSVHCALAVFLAFGPEDKLREYRDWLGTWPRWEEFVESMPVFWNEDFRILKQKVDEAGNEDGMDRMSGGYRKRAKKRRKTKSDVHETDESNKVLGTLEFSRSLGVDDFWLTLPSPSRPPLSSTTASTVNNETHLASQASKLRACIHAINRYFPQLKITSPSSHSFYLKFLHTWALVNTRCFYYLHPGQHAPSDSNEAMALCPFQDLFNHSDAVGCTGVFDKRGFFVTADKDYVKGEELFLCYGNHGNDMLWMEYGFTMQSNKWDTVRLDRVVLGTDEMGGGFGQREKSLLEESGYSGEYSLREDGVCYRTIIASYLGVLDERRWKRMVGGGFDPETSTTHAMLRLKAKQRTIAWILQVRKEADENLKVLVKITAEVELVNSFVRDISALSEELLEKTGMLELAKKRKEMCMNRWKQIFNLCMSAARHVEKECPGAFLDKDSSGRGEVDLALDAERFIKSMIG